MTVNWKTQFKMRSKRPWSIPNTKMNPSPLDKLLWPITISNRYSKIKINSISRILLRPWHQTKSFCLHKLSWKAFKTVMTLEAVGPTKLSNLIWQMLWLNNNYKRNNMEEADNEKTSSQLAKARESSTSSEKQPWNRLNALMMYSFGKRPRVQILEELETPKPELMGKYNR